MPQPLPGTISAAVVAATVRPMPAIALIFGRATVRNIPGPIPATNGSIVYNDVFAYGYVESLGRVTLNRGRKGLRRAARGTEDTNGRQS